MLYHIVKVCFEEHISLGTTSNLYMKIKHKGNHANFDALLIQLAEHMKNVCIYYTRVCVII